MNLEDKVQYVRRLWWAVEQQPMRNGHTLVFACTYDRWKISLCETTYTVLSNHVLIYKTSM